jgi:putative tryptophan/tyrosine transport system substrate-binding protein
MRRREFLGVIGGATVLSMAAQAQQAPMPVVGFLHGGAQEGYAPMMAAFRKNLSEAGYAEGQNVSIELRWAEGRLERLAELAADLVHRQVSLIFAGGGPEPALAAKAATSTIPIVFASGVDPLPQMQLGGLVIGANAFFFSRRSQVVELAARYSVPTVYPWREAVVDLARCPPLC